MPDQLLILTPQLPYPPHQGASLRNYHIIRGLARSFQIHLLSFLEEGQSTTPAVIQPLIDCVASITVAETPERTIKQRLGDMLTSRYPDMGHRLYAHEFEQKLIELLQSHQFKYIQIEGIELARMITTIRDHSPHSRIIFDNHNAETELQRRTMLTDLKQPSRWLPAAYSAVQVQKLRQFERWACENSDAVSAVSAADVTLLKQLAPKQSIIEAVPNCIDIDDYAQQNQSIDLTTQEKSKEAETTFDLIFTGKMDYRPNVDGMIWFLTDIWPLVLEQRPETTLAIVGKNPTPRLAQAAQNRSVTLTGFVPSTTPYIQNTQLVIMPLRMGSGTRLKLIQAMAAGKAIVSTHVGAEGYGVEDGRQLWIADQPKQFAAAILEGLADSDGRDNIGAAAIRFAADYDWRKVIPKFEAIYAQIETTST